MRKPRLVEHDGHRLTIAEWAAELGISKSSFQSRLRRELPPERLFHRGPMPLRNRATPIEFAGQSMTVSEWAKRLGINANVIYDRLEKRWPLDAVFGTPPQHGGMRRPPYTPKAKT